MKRVDAQLSLKDKDINIEESPIKTQKDIVEAFTDWTETNYSKNSTIENKKKIIAQATAWLKEGQDEVLDDGN